MFVRTLLAGISAVSFSMALASPVLAAASTSTPPLLVHYSAGRGIICAVTNVGKKPIQVAHQIVSESGAVQDDGPPTTLAPGATYRSSGIVAPGITGFVYCRAPGFSSKKVHVTTCLMTAADIVNGVGECVAMTTNP